MPILPAKFSYLTAPDMPRMIKNAIALYGIREPSPTIVKWAAEIGEPIASLYKTSDIAWCGLFLGIVAKRSGKVLPQLQGFTLLYALTWRNFGSHIDAPEIGDVLVLKRHGGNHVAIYVAESLKYYYVIGGNQSDAVNIKAIKKTLLIEARRPAYVNKPNSVQKKVVGD